MKTTLLTLVLAGFATAAFATDAPKQTTKTSHKPLDIGTEVKAFYVQLTKSDPDIQKQVEVLTAKTRDAEAGLYFPFEPRAVEWFPNERSWDVWKGTSDISGRFLVIQLIGYGRSKYAGYNTALVAEFSIEYESTSSKLDPKHEDRKPRLISNELKITFLGFRSPDLRPALKPK